MVIWGILLWRGEIATTLSHHNQACYPYQIVRGVSLCGFLTLLFPADSGTSFQINPRSLFFFFFLACVHSLLRLLCNFQGDTVSFLNDLPFSLYLKGGFNIMANWSITITPIVIGAHSLLTTSVCSKRAIQRHDLPTNWR